MPQIINLSGEEIKPALEKLKANYPEIFKIHSHTNQWEKALIYSLCERMSIGSIIFEIGAHLGATSCVMGVAAREISGEVYCVDTWDNQNFPGEPRAKEWDPDIWNAWKKNTNKWKSRTHAYMATSISAAKCLKGEKIQINLIFFDADHSHEGVTADIRAWLPLCAPGCCLVFHDYGGKDGRPAIRQAVEELVFPIQKGPGYTFESIYYCQKR